MSMMKVLLPAIVLLVLVDHVTAQTQPISVRTKYGSLLGTRTTKDYRLGQLLTTVDTYLGVPYAKPPLGILRFKYPQQIEGWQGMRMARTRPPICPQSTGFPNNLVSPPYNVTMDEDCLYLNIYSPVQVNSSNVYPVLVYVHGGGFISGSGVHFNGSVLARYGVVVVTINYRLGALGFLSNGGPELAGNYGLMDQVAALKWVQENIASFRGDPGRVTVFGSGSGGASVGLLMKSKTAKGLFHQAIVSSGPVTTPASLLHDRSECRTQFENVARCLKCPDGSMVDRVRCIQEVKEECFTATHGINFRPTIDDEVVEERDRERFANPVPTMMGFVEDEAMRFIALRELGNSNRQSSDEGRKSLIHLTTLNIPTGLEELVYHEYGYSGAGAQSAVTRRNILSKLMTDRLYSAPTVKMADQLTRQDVPVYLYEFRHHVPLKSPSLKEVSWLGRYSYHGVDLPFIFGAPYLSEPQAYDWHQGAYDSEAKFFSKSMMALWTNFVKRGNPSDIAGVLRPTKWDQYRPNSTTYLLIRQDGAAMKTNLRPRQMAFWNTILPDLQKTSPTPLTPTPDCPEAFFTEMSALAAVATILFLLFIILAICLACRPRHQVKDASLIECQERSSH